MGDISGRQGYIDVGGPRKVFTDSNLPLAGNYTGKVQEENTDDESFSYCVSDLFCYVMFTVMKKSIVIFEKNGNNLRFACANILPDNDITQKVQIKKLNRISG